MTKRLGQVLLFVACMLFPSVFMTVLGASEHAHHIAAIPFFVFMVHVLMMVLLFYAAYTDDWDLDIKLYTKLAAWYVVGPALLVRKAFKEFVRLMNWIRFGDQKT